MAGADLPAGHRLDGHDLRAFLTGEAASPRMEFAYQRGQRLEAVRDSRWKLRVDPDSGTVELFDLQVDPYEWFNVAADHPGEVERLRGRMETLAEEAGAALTPIVENGGPLFMNQLRESAVKGR